ncbi:LysR family transcriptional regulator ArgP [Streptomyces antibioticus]|uniref:HTH-type transcriptional regulator LysG n=1 Tax=Streptomyces antibioticus TaxID=1890 RepID=A0AAE6Y383_STRAT|nr:LysR family transcriptional regulator ArgP [Streptomyces antibioticus]MCX5166979.1 LysR family transcriptional regulator ArgP [Streptomyces antibioticus]OOQ54954.1 chromosome replication initiation inhibitor protein [Streptomyces antibioticus]QIT42600.1 LysR family transcriptional regulator ArgP [Streptomyces antibioticus]
MVSDLPLDLVRTLLAVVDEGTFDAAAAALHVTPSAVSQRVKALEQRTGRVLLLRTKPVRPTESGEIVVRFARQLARLERDTRSELGMSDAGEPARVTVAVNADSLATWFLPALSRVPREPPLRFELFREDETRTAELLREGVVMAAVTSSPDAVAGCSVRALGTMRYLAAASPEFVARHLDGLPLAEALTGAPVIIFDRSDDLQDGFVRELSRGAGQASGVRHAVPSSEGFAASVAAGLGWGMVPEAQADALLRSGGLVSLAPDRPLDVPLYWQQWKLDSPALAALSRAVAEEAARALRN